MKRLLNTRLLLLCALPLLTHCGGGGGAAPTSGPASPGTPTTPTTPDVSPWSGTAHVRQELRTLHAGKASGPARAAALLQFQACNEYRTKGYGLPAVLPAETVLAGIDTQTVERYYDSGKALTWFSGYTIEPTDLKRWMDEVAAKPDTLPAVPPDCALYRKLDIATGSLWVDGVAYELRPDKKAVGRHSAPSLKESELFTAAQIAAMTPSKVMEQACLLSSTSGPLGTSTACFSTRFPLKAYLSWPWPLESRTYSGSGEAATVAELKALEVSLDKPSPTGLFKVPDGFTVVMQD